MYMLGCVSTQRREAPAELARFEVILYDYWHTICDSVHLQKKTIERKVTDNLEKVKI